MWRIGTIIASRNCRASEADATYLIGISQKRPTKFMRLPGVVIRSVIHRIRCHRQSTLPMRNVALVLFCAIGSGVAQRPQPVPMSSVVYAVHDPDSIRDYKTNSRVVREMVNRLVLATTGQPDLAKAWASLVSPDDKIGVKISAAGGELFTTHHDVVNAIVDGLVAAGHPRSSIIVWDRSLGGIKDAGYRVGIDGYQLKGIAPGEGYDSKAMLSAPLLGQLVWGDFDYRADTGKILLFSDMENTSNVSHFSKILSTEVTKIIN